jgi:L-2-hydroxyglutarate oxidase LhgO
VRENPTIDTLKLCQKLVEVLDKKENVKILYNTSVSKYSFDKENTNLVSHIELDGENERLEVTDVVICVGPQARKHISTYFGTILPLISA